MCKPEFLTLCLALLLALIGPIVSSAGELAAPTTVEVTLQNTKAHDAATSLRGIAGTRFEILSDQVLRLQGTPEEVLLAEQVLALVDSEADAPLTDFTVPSDQSRVSAFRLAHIPAVEALKALRRVVRISKVFSRQQPALVIVRDTPANVESERALIEILDQPCP